MSLKDTGLEDLSTDSEMSDEPYLPPRETGAYAAAASSYSHSTGNNGRLQRRSKKQAKTTKAKTTKRKRAPSKPKPKSTGTRHHTGPFQPIRDYYHSTSFLKIKDNEWKKNIDSDDELDQTWLHELEKSDIHDYTDIKEEEKKLMLHWNNFVRSDTIIPAKKIPQLCLDFVEQRYETIRDEGIGSTLPWHLVNLWDEGLISADHLSFCIEHYHDLAGSPPL